MELFDDMWNSKDIVRDSYLFHGSFFFSYIGDFVDFEMALSVPEFTRLIKVDDVIR
jgi:hypothetical protein